MALDSGEAMKAASILKPKPYEKQMPREHGVIVAPLVQEACQHLVAHPEDVVARVGMKAILDSRIQEFGHQR
jgi:hypothetical protein